MAIRITAVLPLNLQQERLLDLEIRGRSDGDNVVFWDDSAEKLTVLFDGVRWQSLRDYGRWKYVVVPGVEMITNLNAKSATIGDNIAGIVLDAPNHTLSYFFQQRWKGNYLSNAKSYNAKKGEMPLLYFWRYFAATNIAWYQNSPEIEEVRNNHDAFAYIIEARLRGIYAHIPLVEDLAQLVSLN